MKIFKIIKNTTFLVLMLITLTVSTVSLGVKVVALTGQVAISASALTANAIKHRSEIAALVAKNRTAVSRALAKAKAKARLKRTLVAIPIVGAAAAVAFEASDYLNWQEENPDKTKQDYACENAALTAEVLDGVLAELPELLRPPEAVLAGLIPECD